MAGTRVVGLRTGATQDCRALREGQTRSPLRPHHLLAPRPPPPAAREDGQWSGLLTSCINFPDLKNTRANGPGLVSQALDELNKLLASSVYPDGVETEQASGYE
jgi:hypothetical protein